MSTRYCQCCGAPLPELRLGRPRGYCNGSCKRRAAYLRADISADEIEQRFAAAKAAIQARRRAETSSEGSRP